MLLRAHNNLISPIAQTRTRDYGKTDGTIQAVDAASTSHCDSCHRPDDSEPIFGMSVRHAPIKAQNQRRHKQKARLGWQRTPAPEVQQPRVFWAQRKGLYAFFSDSTHTIPQTHAKSRPPAAHRSLKESCHLNVSPSTSMFWHWRSNMPPTVRHGIVDTCTCHDTPSCLAFRMAPTPLQGQFVSSQIDRSVFLAHNVSGGYVDVGGVGCRHGGQLLCCCCQGLLRAPLSTHLSLSTTTTRWSSLKSLKSCILLLVYIYSGILMYSIYTYICVNCIHICF